MNRFERWLLWISTALVAVSGAVYGWMKYLLRSDDPFAVTHSPWQPLVLKVHVLAAPVLVFAAGAVFSRHAVKKWTSNGRDGRRTGGAVVGVLVPMVVSGYLIQTLTSESWLFRVAMIHIAASVLYLAGLLAHRFLAPRGRVH